MDADLHETINLVEAAQKGDRQAEEDLFRRYLPRVRQIVSLRLGYRLRDFAAFEDHVQEALLKAFQNLDQFEHRTEGTFRNWISRCVANSMNDTFRRQNAQRRGGGKVRVASAYESEDMTQTLFRGNDPTPSAILRGKELLEKIEASLLELKEHHREVIILRRFCEMSYDEVARSMGFGDETTVRKVFSRAMKKLRETAGLESV